MKRAGDRGSPPPAWPFGAHGRRLGSASDIRWLRHGPLALFVVGILAYGAAFAWDMLHCFDLLNLVRDGFRDDAYYYFQIAYHMAEGRFSTFDGGLTRTNGYHPLWLFLVTPFYWVFDKTEALFAIKAFEIMLLAGGVALVAVAARVARLPWILLFAVLPALYAQPGMLLGMESALALFTLGLLFLAVCLFSCEPVRWRWLLAAVLFALPWARLEYVAIAVAVPIALCFIEWTGRLPGAETAADNSSSRVPGLARLRLALRQAAVPLAGAFAGILVYFAYNGIVFGGVLPVSGATKAFWSHRRFREEGGYDLAANFDAFADSRFFDDELLTALEVCLYALLVWWLSRRFRSREGGLLLAFMVGVFGLAAGHLAKFAYSVLFVHPDFGKFTWYYIPAYLMEALVVPARCFVGLYVLRCVLGRRLPRTSDVLRFGGIVVVGAALLAKADFAAPFRFVDTHDELRFHGEGDLHAYSGVAAMNRLLPKNALVGSFDSGVVGYFARAQVMNLDGLVNSYGNKEALADRGNNVFDLFGLSYVGNIYYKRQPAHSLIGDARPVFETHANGLSHQRRGPKQFRLYSRRESPAWFRERMAARLERQPDGTRLLTEGRLAQAFAMECAADEVAAWAFGQSEERAVSTWTRVADGSCSTAAVVPKGSSSPVRVQRMALDEAVAFRVGGERPAIKGEFDVYLLERRLFYVKGLCKRADVETRFFLHLVPAADDFDEGRESLGFNSANFMLEEYGGGRASWGADGSSCLAEVPLPKYAIATASTGQFKAEGPVWEGVTPIDLERNADGVGFAVAGRTAQAFALECAADELALWTFGSPEKQAISTWTRTADGSCMSVFALQHGHQPPLRVRRAVLDEALTQRTGGLRPAIRADSTQPGGFDVYLAKDALVYVKEACERADVETPFFLHVVPAGDDFDDGRESTGYNNLDFMLAQRGHWLGEEGEIGPCLAEVPLPPYRIAEIRTGQYMAEDFHRVWEGEIGRDQLKAEGA